MSIIALSFSLKSAIPSCQHDTGLTDGEIWKRSIATAVASRAIARVTRSRNPEAAFLCGLISRLGQLLLFSLTPEPYGKLLDRTGGRLPTPSEEELELGVTHHQVAHALLRQWGLPSLICNVVANWDDPERCVDEEARLTAKIVRVADASAELIFSDDKAAGLQQLHRLAEEFLQLSRGEVERMFLASQTELEETLEIFDNRPENEIDLQEIMETARVQLVQTSLGLAADLTYARTEADCLEQANQHLKKEASTDALTGLPNRAALDAELESLAGSRAEAHSLQPYSLIMVDVDHFKQFNDTHGHAVGDEVLRTVGRALAASTRSTDFVARYGGEEFLVILTNVGEADATLLADRFRVAVEKQPVVCEGQTLSVTASLGVASSDQFDRGMGYEDILKAADAALYDAKHAGRNCVKAYAKAPRSAN